MLKTLTNVGNKIFVILLEFCLELNLFNLSNEYLL